MHLGLQDGDPTVMVSESLPRRSRPGPLSQGCSELGEGGGEVTLLFPEEGGWAPPLGQEEDTWILCTIHVSHPGPR